MDKPNQLTMPTILIHQRIMTVVSFVIVGLVALVWLQISPQFDSTATSLQPLLLILLIGVTFTGSESLIRAQPRLPSRHLDYLISCAVPPSLLVIAAAQLLPYIATPIALGIGIVGVTALLWLSILGQVRLAQVERAEWTGYHLLSHLISYAAILVIFVTLYQTREVNLSMLGGLVVVTFMAIVALLPHTIDLLAKTWLFAVVISLSMGQLAWVLSYWLTDPTQAGVTLFLLLYSSVSVAHQHLRGRLSVWLLVELGVVVTASLWWMISV